MGNWDSVLNGKVHEEKTVEPADFSSRLLAKYEPERQIGSGAFGAVYLVRERSSGLYFCAKRVKNSERNAQEPELLLRVGRNPNTVNLKETISDPHRNELYIVMEYCEGGNLKDWIRRNHRYGLLTEPVVLQMLWRICEAVQGCHELHTLHRDLKPENIFLHQATIKLGDFGVARQLDEHSAATSICGTPPYMAPEVFQAYTRRIRGEAAAGYNFSSDIWSIGCILLDMANKKGVLFPDRKVAIGSRAADALDKGSDPALSITATIDEEVPPDWLVIRRLLPRMLCGKAECRISLEEILTDPGIQRCVSTEPHLKWTQNSMKVQQFDKLSAV